MSHTVLHVRAGDRFAVIGDAEVVIGRSPYCSLRIDHGSVSRVHASLKRAGGALELRDLGSSNGTSVNGKRIAEALTVRPGDRIRVGSVDVVIEEAAARTSASTGMFHVPDPDPLEDTTKTIERPKLDR